MLFRSGRGLGNADLRWMRLRCVDKRTAFGSRQVGVRTGVGWGGGGGGRRVGPAELGAAATGRGLGFCEVGRVIDRREQRRRSSRKPVLGWRWVGLVAGGRGQRDQRSRPYRGWQVDDEKG